MIWVLMILLAILLVFLSALWWPLIITIDTRVHQYGIRLSHVLEVMPVWREESIFLRIKIPFRHFDIDLLKKAKGRRKTREKKGAFGGFNATKSMAIIRSFKVRRFEMIVDTDDYALNALLVPLIQLAKTWGFNVSINFQGQTYCMLEVQNTLWKIGTEYWKARNK